MGMSGTNTMAAVDVVRLCGEFECLVWSERAGNSKVVFFSVSYIRWQYPFDDEDEVRKKKPRRKLTTGASITRANVRS